MHEGTIRPEQRLRQHLLFAARLVLATALLTIVTWIAAYAQSYREFIPIWPGSGIVSRPPSAGASDKEITSAHSCAMRATRSG